MSGPFIKVGDWSREDAKREYREFWAEMYPVVVKAVEFSLLNGTTAVRNPTQAVVKERVDMAKSLVDTMRREFGWSKTRIRDNLAIVMRSQIAGIAVDLETMGRRGTW